MGDNMSNSPISTSNIHFRLFSCLLLLLAAPLLMPVYAQTTPPLEIVEFRTLKLGDSWVNLVWEARGENVSIEWRAIRGTSAERRWKRISDIQGNTWTVSALRPDALYRFRLHVSTGKDTAYQEIISKEIEASTLSEKTVRWDILDVQSPRQLATSTQTSPAFCCIENWNNQIYLLESTGSKLIIKRLNTLTLQVELTRELISPLDETPDFNMPDTCVFRDQLWIIWHSRKPGRTPQDAPRYRVRLASVDLASLDNATKPVSLGAILELPPRGGGTSTSWGSIAVFQDSIWVCWTEYRSGPMGVPRSNLQLGQYDPEKGYIPYPIIWTECPTNRPERGHISIFGADLQLLFSDAALQDRQPGTVPLLAANFDGKRFYDLHQVRNLGINTAARGVQYFDKYYFAYETDVQYPTGAGLFQDIHSGRFPSSDARGLTALDILNTGFPLTSDRTYNTMPDLTVLNDELFIVWTKWQVTSPPLESHLSFIPQTRYGVWLCRLKPAKQ